MIKLCNTFLIVPFYQVAPENGAEHVFDCRVNLRYQLFYKLITWMLTCVSGREGGAWKTLTFLQVSMLML